MSQPIIADDFFFDGITKGRKCYVNQDYENAVIHYSSAFNINDKLPIFLYRLNAAEAYAFTGNYDSAFVLLNKLIYNFKYNDLLQIKNNRYFNKMVADERWEKLINQLEANKKHIDSALIKTLDSLVDRDQFVRKKAYDVKKKFGNDSKEYSDILGEWKLIDSSNQLILDSLIGLYGWLGYRLVGVKGSGNFFLLLQHTDLIRQTRYLPLFQKSVYEGDANPDDLAMLIDRIELRNGRKQVYGSQFFYDPSTNKKYIHSLEDPKYVNHRRIRVGLMPMEEYCGYIGIEWNYEHYIKILPNIEILEKKLKTIRSTK